MESNNELKQNKIITLTGDYEGYKIAYDSLVKKLATEVFIKVSSETGSGAMCVYQDEIENLLKNRYFVDLKDIDIKEFMEDVANTVELDFASQVSDVEFYEDDAVSLWVIDVNLYHAYALQYLEDDACFEVEED